MSTTRGFVSTKRSVATRPRAEDPHRGDDGDAEDEAGGETVGHG
jgi:hypothetical protein